jgi:Ca2+/Na+ antiporter
MRLSRVSRLRRPQSIERGVFFMLWAIFVVVLVLWLLGFSFHIAGSLIHLLLVVALIILVFNLVSGRRTVL